MKTLARRAYFALGRRLSWHPAWPVLRAEVQWTPRVGLMTLPGTPPPSHRRILVELFNGDCYEGELTETARRTLRGREQS